jgi:hypothetical protein
VSFSHKLLTFTLFHLAKVNKIQKNNVSFQLKIKAVTRVYSLLIFTAIQGETIIAEFS